MAEISTCTNFSCRAKVEDSVEKCPRCGKKMRTPKTVRRLGWVLLALGLFLIVLMGTITWNLAPMMMHPGDPTATGSSFTGTADQARMILRLFAVVIVFGVATAFNGIWQIVTGRRNLVIMWIVLGIAGVLLVYAWITSRALG